MFSSRRTPAAHAISPLLLLLAALPMLLVTPRAHAQPDASGDDGALNAAEGPIVVAVKPAEPFVMPDGEGGYRGISIELWERIAGEIGVEYSYTETDIPGLLDMVESGEAAVGVAALTVTAERERRIDFTHPFYHGGLGIAVNAGDEGFTIGTILRLFSPAVIVAIGTLALLLLAVGLVVWIAERRKNADQFGGGVVNGLASGFWFSAVTMTTVGYGDKAPVSKLGRFVTLIWMFTSIIVISFFTGGIASAITAAQLTSDIRGPEDLDSARVGTIEGSATIETLRARGVKAKRYADVAGLLDALESDKIDAAVHDASLLEYNINVNERDARLLEATFSRQPYAIALTPGSGNREQINRLLLDTINSEDWQGTVTDYLQGE